MAKKTPKKRFAPQDAPINVHANAEPSAARSGSSREAGPRKRPSLSVVGIGASAGGLDSFRELLQNLPPDSGMAFVIVQHLAQDQKSMLPDILARSTTMPVLEVVDATPLAANRVYVMSSQADVEYRAGALVIRKRERRKKHLPVDRLFVTLAEGLGERAVGVILSGTDGDGSTGAQHIKAAGGVTFAQDDSAQFDGMPKSAIGDGGLRPFAAGDRAQAHGARRPAACRCRPTAIRGRVRSHHRVAEAPAAKSISSITRRLRSSAGSTGACSCRT